MTTRSAAWSLAVLLFCVLAGAGAAEKVLDRETIVVQPKKVSTRTVPLAVKAEKPAARPAPPRPRVKTLEIYFPRGSARLEADERDRLGRLDARKKGIIVIEGHASSPGGPAFNKKLSLRRARAVLKILSERYPDSRFIIRGFGESRPRYTNKTARGREANQRAVIRVR